MADRARREPPVEPPAPTGTPPAGDGFDREPMALAELVSRVVERGAVVTGDLVVSVADVDLLYVSLDVLLTTADRIDGEPSRNDCGSP